MHFAVSKGVAVKLCAYISPDDLCWGYLEEDTCVASAEFRVDSSAALCGKAEDSESPDEKMIQKVIDKSEYRFNSINQSIEDIILSYLVKYPINKIKCNQLAAIPYLKKAIECTIPCINVRHDLKTYDQYLQSEKLNDDEDKNFKAW